VAYTLGGRKLVAAGEKGLRVWEMGPPVVDGDRDVPVDKPLTGVAIQPGSGVAAAGCVDGSIRLFEPSLDKEKSALKGHTGEVRCVAFNADGKRLASGGVDGTVRVWDPATGKELHVFKGHAHVVLTVAFAPDGRTLASGSADGVVRLWNVEGGKELATLPARKGVPMAHAVAFSPDGATLAAAVDREVRRWDVTRIVGAKVDAPKTSVAAPEGPRPWKTQACPRNSWTRSITSTSCSATEAVVRSRFPTSGPSRENVSHLGLVAPAVRPRRLLAGRRAGG
jgi:WD40 repeat protein